MNSPKINENYVTTFQCKPDENHTCLRFCTSWATNEQAVEDFIKDLKNGLISMLDKYQNRRYDIKNKEKELTRRLRRNTNGFRPYEPDTDNAGVGSIFYVND